MRGAIGVGSGSAATSGSCVFKPLPVMHKTVGSSFGMRPSAMSRFAVATVTPPAVSVKTPSVDARSLIASMISSSLTAAAWPPEPRIACAAYGPSAGLPMASDLAMVFGFFTGLMASRPASTASAMGPQPAACAP